MCELRILPAGDRAVVAEFGSTIDPEINGRVHALARQLGNGRVPGVTELIPTFRSLLIHYDPAVIDCGRLTETINSLALAPADPADTGKKLLHIPCCYGSHFGPDLDAVARLTGFSRDEVIALHSAADYPVYMLGFLPGFVYLGGLDSRLHSPRLSTPRVKIPRGSVGIGGSQTGVYPIDSPGGWRLIGGTPVEFYSPDQEPPVLCRPGDVIRFEPISSSDYYDIRQEMLHKRYRLRVDLL